jgi:hypothetical protein|tara:strand:- start:80 stop:694 length:615 start_codon:yes stop_codon:yes gene_type:complete
MILKKASYKAIKYACIKFHYAKSVPVNVFGYSVFNKKNEWCGVILFGTGATPNLAKPYNLKQGQAIELVRMALNGKQESTSKALALSLKLVKKNLPLCKIIISYADIDQEHTGIIYQATNWIYEGEFNKGTVSGYLIKGKKVHNKTIYSKGIKQNLESVRKYIDANAEKYITKGKRKYVYPLTKQLKDKCLKLKKPYPKNASKA